MPLDLLNDAPVSAKQTRPPAPELPAKAAAPVAAPAPPGKLGHRVRVTFVALLLASLIVALAAHGWPYYRLGLEDRPFSPLHSQLRSSGSIGVKLGMLGVAMFGVLFLYPLRKRWPWLSRIGSTRRWLDFHVVMGIMAPIVITFHAAFKFQGLAGLAYWIMVAVALSGFVGRYVYAQIPRSLNSAKLTAGELEAQASALALSLATQHAFDGNRLGPLLRVPSAAEVKKLTLIHMLWVMAVKDLARPFRIAALRRQFLRGPEIVTTLGGLRASRHRDVESIVANIREQSWLLTKMAFLDRTERIFHLWHVIHRPFSMSFVALVIIHVSVILVLGYY
jgi:hypothetical protein